MMLLMLLRTVQCLLSGGFFLVMVSEASGCFPSGSLRFESCTLAPGGSLNFRLLVERRFCVAILCQNH